MVRKKYGRIIASVLAAIIGVGGGTFSRKYRFCFCGRRIKGADFRNGKLQR